MTMTRDEAVRTIEHAATVLAGDGEPTIAANLIAARTTLAAHIAQQDATIARLTELADVADGIISVCGGDAWERECTADDRNEYARLRADLFPQPEPATYWHPYVSQAKPCPTPCELCGCTLKTEEGRRQHLRDKHNVPWEATKHNAAIDAANEPK